MSQYRITYTWDLHWFVSCRGIPRLSCSKESARQWRRCKRCKFNLLVEKILKCRQCQPTPVFLPGKFHGQRVLAGYSPEDYITKITADGDCSLEIKRRLLLGRKAMTNLDSILKSRNISVMMTGNTHKHTGNS